MAVEPDALKKFIGVHAMPSPLRPVGKNIHTVLEMPYSKVRDSLAACLRSVTMKELVDEYHEALAN